MDEPAKGSSAHGTGTRAARGRNHNAPAAWMSILHGCLAVSLFCLIYPVYVIRPFRHQGVRELAAALAILRFRPGVLAVCAGLALVALIFYARSRHSGWPRVLAGIEFAALCVSAALCRVNIYELMFHPIEHPRFEAARETRLDRKEQVIAVRIGGAARAYPIRIVSYHHVVNDSVSGVPIVATY